MSIKPLTLKSCSVTFEKSWPKGFYDTITKSVRTIASATKSSRLGHAGSEAVNADHTLIYTRTIGLLSSSRDIRMNDVLEYELAPVTTALYNEAGEMRAVTKSVLKKKLCVARSYKMFEVVPSTAIIDACAMLWCVPWPAQPSTVADYVAAFTATIKRKLSESDILHIVFDR